jgi:tetratricopeptide (TPR) repeat protein
VNARAACIAVCLALAAALSAGFGARADGQVPNWVMKGNAALARGDLQTALNDFTAGTEQLPDDPAPWYNRALLYARLGRNGEALADAERAVAVQPFLDEGFALIARLKQAMLRFGEALASIDRALALKPHEAPYHLRRAEILRLLNRAPEAAPEYAAALRDDPSSTAALRGEAELFLAERRDGDALRVLRTYAKLAPDDADVNVAVAGLLVQTGRAQDALAWIAAHPSADPRMTDYQAGALAKLGQRSAAAAMLGPVAFVEPPYRTALRAQLAFEAGRCREAADAYEIVASSPETSALAWRNYGAASACAHDDVTAVAAFTRAIGLNPLDPLAVRYRANAYRNLGNRAAAIRDTRDALRLGGPDADLLMLLGIDEYLDGAHEQGRRDYAQGCALLDPAETEKHRRCDEQLPKLKP